MSEPIEGSATKTDTAPDPGPGEGWAPRPGLVTMGWERLSEWTQMRRDPLALLETIRKEGDLLYLTMGARRTYLLLHPDYVRDVLVTHHRKFGLSDTWQEVKRLFGNGLLHSEGEFHRRQRRMANPAFHHTRIAEYAKVMAEYADRAAGKWEDGAELDIHVQMMWLTLAVVGTTLFDADLEGEDTEQFREAGMALAKLFRLGTPVAPMMRELPVEATRKFEEHRAVMDEFIYRMIRERRESGEDRGDLLSMLLLAQDEEGDGGSMTDQQLRDECMTLIAAGHETTANSLTWTWYLLSQHPDVEEKLHHELDTVLGGRPPGVEDLPSLVYTRKVLNESMRLYPPAWILLRQVLEDHDFGGSIIPTGARIAFFPYLLHRDPRWWPEPDRFDPDRWTDDAESRRPRFSYIPFGAGPRMCIGEQFAWMEATLIVATVGQQWHLGLRPGHRVVPEPRVNLRPRNGIPMIPTRRA